MDMLQNPGEPDYSLLNVLFVVVAFAAYFLGIVIRKLVIPGGKSLSLSCQLLLGIPVSLLVVSPLLPVLSAATLEPPVFFVTLGVIMEHGMIVNETATYHLNKLKGGVGHAPAGTRRRKPVSIT
jgi:hypothetical protein